MSHRPSVLVALICALACVPHLSAAAVAQKSIKRDDARKLIAALSVLELDRAAVNVKEIAPTDADGTASVLAGVRLAFRFVKDETGAWRVAEVRTGDRQWESLALLERALGGETVAPVRAELDALAAELDALAGRKAARDGEAQPSVDNDANQPAKELRRGALSVKNPADALAPLGSSAVVEIEVETTVDFARDARGRWQVARVRFDGGRRFDAFAAFERALGAEKLARARADLETLAAALEDYRRARGFYVVANTSSALADHLNPRHTRAFIRFDPWHHPYEYTGTRDRFTLRSLGADGKADTPDDVTIAK